MHEHLHAFFSTYNFYASANNLRNTTKCGTFSPVPMDINLHRIIQRLCANEHTFRTHFDARKHCSECINQMHLKDKNSNESRRARE